MPNHSALVIANKFLRLAPEVAYDQMKLQKLVYIAQGWNLAINNEPLVSDRIEAWDGGPVFRSIWDHIRDFGLNKYAPPLLIDQITSQPFDKELTSSEGAIISHVWKKYGKFSGKELSDLTHQDGTPWYKAYMRARNWPILNKDIREHYLQLVQAGRDAAAHSS